MAEDSRQTADAPPRRYEAVSREREPTESESKLLAERRAAWRAELERSSARSMRVPRFALGMGALLGLWGLGARQLSVGLSAVALCVVMLWALRNERAWLARRLARPGPWGDPAEQRLVQELTVRARAVVRGLFDHSDDAWLLFVIPGDHWYFVDLLEVPDAEAARAGSLARGELRFVRAGEEQLLALHAEGEEVPSVGPSLDTQAGRAEGRREGKVWALPEHLSYPGFVPPQELPAWVHEALRDAGLAETLR